MSGRKNLFYNGLPGTFLSTTSSPSSDLGGASTGAGHLNGPLPGVDRSTPLIKKRFRYICSSISTGNGSGIAIEYGKAGRPSKAGTDSIRSWSLSTIERD